MLSLCLYVFVVGSSFGQASGKPSAYLQAKPEALRWWREARFGLFVHWGPVSLKGTEIGWSRGGERPGIGGTGEIPVAVYDNLYKQFNPVKFNAREWVAIAKAAGMKYIVFTSKHHDGFTMFDSALTDYKITNSPFKRDVVAELAQACHEAGMRIGFYYSPPDFHHPDFRTANHARYIQYMRGQIRELCTKYGRVDILWFDGLNTTAQENDADNLIKMIRQLQPNILINNRSGLPGDFDTPEQTIGKFQNTRPWESCITICNQWAWKPNDTMKPLKECLQTLIRCAGGDGNLLFNVGPMPTGEIEPRQVARLKEIGAWLKQYGKTIYGTRGGPFVPGTWGASTCKGRTVYVHVLNSAAEPLVLPPLPCNIIGSSLLTGRRVSVRQTPQGTEIAIPPADRKEIDNIVQLTLDGNAETIPPIRPPSRSLAFGKSARASNIFQNMPEYAPGRALDDDETTRWATDAGTHSAWLEVDMGKPQEIVGVFIGEECGSRVQEFEIQYKEGDNWKTFAQGTTIGPEFRMTFPPVTARIVRLNILRASEGPTLSEFHLFPADPQHH
jgi:alpha-L-fucosidase